MTWQPNDGKFHATLEAGFACYKAERFEEAARILGDILPTIVSPQVPEQAIAADPNFAPAWRNLGNAWRDAGA